MPAERPVPLVSYLDIVLVVLGAPILIAIGVSATGYGIGGGAWLALRAVGLGMDRVLVHREGEEGGTTDARIQISARLGYMLGRLFLLAVAVIVARSSGGRDAGLTALLVIVFAFTVQLAVSAAYRPRRQR